MIAEGVYTLTEAGRYTDVSARTARAWFRGWPGSSSGPILYSDYAGHTDSDIISFLDLVDLLVVGQLRNVRASIPSIRAVYDKLAKHLRTEHPFGHSSLLVDDVGTLFVHAASEAGQETLVDVLRRQQAFPSILLPFLKRLDYDSDTHLAKRYRVCEGVLLDAKRRYGKPITEKSALPTIILARSYYANNQDIETVADWYGVSALEVEQAVRFEGEIREAA